ncbi:hypothetical protein [Bdellovibrio sp. HCB209]|uniref:hypothetical protein n=1 Tax=Bdellovibrio sp. HCB209 TaxID=3394354 RepID=UPI0039B4F302
MKKLILLLVTAFSVTAFVGCSNNDSGGGGVAPVTCNYGSTWNGQYCVTNNGQIVTPGTVSTRYYDYVYYFQIDYYTKMQVSPLYAPGTGQTKSMRITNAAVYKKFLKEAMAVCDRTIWGWNSGYASCDTWANGSLILQVDMTNNLKPAVYFTAIPSPQFYTFNIGIDGGGMAFNPLALIQNTTYNVYNQDKGFQIRTNGSSYNGGGLHLIEIHVPNGKINDKEFAYQIAYPDSNGKGTFFATGVMTRY